MRQENAPSKQPFICPVNRRRNPAPQKMHTQFHLRSLTQVSSRFHTTQRMRHPAFFAFRRNPSCLMSLFPSPAIEQSADKAVRNLDRLRRG
jgi:hypothetical protein